MVKKLYIGLENLRSYVNYEQLNAEIIKNRYLLVLFKIIVKRICGAKKYLKLNI